MNTGPSWVRTVGRAIATHPVTVGYVSLLWVVGAATGSLLAGPADPLASAVRLSVEAATTSSWAAGSLRCGRIPSPRT